jgi:hypothetical protein
MLHTWRKGLSKEATSSQKQPLPEAAFNNGCLEALHIARDRHENIHISMDIQTYIYTNI